MKEKFINAIKSLDKKSILISLGIAIFCIILDQFTKYIIETKMTLHQSIPVIEGFFSITSHRNTGAAWGMMSGKQTLFIILTAVMLIGIVFLYVKAPEDKKFTPLRITMAVLAGGAIGNFIDRVSKGYVDDFIDFHLINFPVFNFADICVCISMFVLVFLIIFKYKDDDLNFLKFKKNNKEQERDSDKTT